MPVEVKAQPSAPTKPWQLHAKLVASEFQMETLGGIEFHKYLGVINTSYPLMPFTTMELPRAACTGRLLLIRQFRVVDRDHF